MDNDPTVGALKHLHAKRWYTCKKPLSMYNLLNLTELVNLEVPSGLIYICNNLLHLDPGLFQY